MWLLRHEVVYSNYFVRPSVRFVRIFNKIKSNTVFAMLCWQKISDRIFEILKGNVLDVIEKYARI